MPISKNVFCPKISHNSTSKSFSPDPFASERAHAGCTDTGHVEHISGSVSCPVLGRSVTVGNSLTRRGYTTSQRGLRLLGKNTCNRVYEKHP